MFLPIVRVEKKEKMKEQIYSRDNNRVERVPPVPNSSGLPDWASVHVTTAELIQNLPQPLASTPPIGESLVRDDHDASHFEDLSDVSYDPCPECGSLEYWENILGERFCMQCKPRGKSRQHACTAKRLRRRADRQHAAKGNQ